MVRISRAPVVLEGAVKRWAGFAVDTAHSWEAHPRLFLAYFLRQGA